MSQPRRKLRGFTLVELLVVIAIIGVLVALLLPAVQAAREATRRMSCSNNVKNIVLAIHNYAEANKQFPIGSRANTNSSYGQSWTVGILPYIEQDALYAQWDHKIGWAGNNVTLVSGTSGIILTLMRCPSSPLLKRIPTVNVMQANYVGIAGTTDGSQALTSFNPGFTVPAAPNGRRSDAGTGATGGWQSSNGVFHAGSQTTFGDLTRDGTSNTIFIGEQSDIMKTTASPPVQQEATNSYPNGAFAGSKVAWAPGLNSGTWDSAAHAITTVRYPVNYKITNNSAGTGQGGANCGIFSPHSGGSLIGWGDGRVSFISESLDMTVLYRVCSRDDGLPVQLPDR